MSCRGQRGILEIVGGGSDDRLERQTSGSGSVNGEVDLKNLRGERIKGIL